MCSWFPYLSSRRTHRRRQCCPLSSAQELPLSIFVGADFPVLLIGAEVLPGERMPSTEDGPGPGLYGRGYRCSVTAGYCRPAGAGPADLAAAACPSGLPPEMARHGRPEVSQMAYLPPSPPLVPVMVPVSITHTAR
jgi:hypothetical protein